MDPLARLLAPLFGPPREGAALPLFDVAEWLEGPGESDTDALAALTAAFLVALSAGSTAAGRRAEQRLASPPLAAPDGLARFYGELLASVRSELGGALASEERLGEQLELAARQLAQADSQAGALAVAEALWSVFFPEGMGIVDRQQQRIEELRARRTVRLSRLNERPIGEPTREVLFTSNVLLTTPSDATPINELPLGDDARAELRAAVSEPQLYWYDHPIQIGVELEANELLYGLRGLDRALGFERARDASLGPATVVLSLSVTHAGLRRVAHEYARRELARSGGLEHLVVYLFTEDDTRQLVEQVLAPIAGVQTAESIAEVFGVDGEYGRHYSFLKAIAGLWQVLLAPDVRATFKIDLDQVFPQRELVEQSGASALEHLRTPLWGARGVDGAGRPVELGMLAGALVNERDIGRGLFTPDVDFPGPPSAADEFIFFSKLPQALSTRAEMMERHAGAERDGRSACLERVHVTGGTNGILVDALRRHRPFTPSFIGRAEDQAYLLSALDPPAAEVDPARLAYAHAAGLIMRHDKEAFAGEAIEAARAGKLVGDDVRILYFSAYAELLGRERVKALLDPFTGCFISRLPRTVVALRFALRVAQALNAGDRKLAFDLATNGARRIGRAMHFTAQRARLAAQVERERAAWHAFYDTLDELERGLREGQSSALQLRDTARELVAATKVS